jgi:hypothetical protein
MSSTREAATASEDGGRRLQMRKLWFRCYADLTASTVGAAAVDVVGSGHVEAATGPRQRPRKR